MAAEGLCFPVTGGTDKDGKPARSTQITGKKILAAALAPVNAEAASKCADERSWRFKYKKHFVKSVEVSAASPDAALKVAKAGLDYMYDNFEFHRDGKSMVLRKALQTYKGTFSTATIKGTGRRPDKLTLEVPYNGKVLAGDELELQLDKWVRQGVCELSCGAAISQVNRSEGWLDLSDRYFVLLGAGAAMGPLEVLLALGANVIAVDLDREQIWRRLITLARSSWGSLTFPLEHGAKASSLSDDELFAKAGCNLFTQTPEIRNWLLTVHPGKHLTVGGYAYIPGDLFPRVALAMDVIIEALSEQRGASVAFLCTPTDCHLVPPAATAAAKDNLRKSPTWQKVFGAMSGGKCCIKNVRRPVMTDDGKALHIVDALVVAQGPNYALAKRMQHWRAMLARAAGCTISSNIAPSTRTVSVTQNKTFAYVFSTIHAFKPYEIPGPETSNAVMTALLIHDLNEPMHAGSPNMALDNPQQIFSQGSFHGGTWRCGYTFDSIGVPCVLAYYLNTFIVRNYLVLYNFVQACGWAFMMYKAAQHYADPAGTKWDAFGEPLGLFQNLAMLEVLHALLGMVRAPWFNTAIQIASRVLVVNLVPRHAELRDMDALYILAAAWGITEVNRYSWYGINLLGKPLRAHTWLRYSTFILLYPLGVFGELLIWRAEIPAEIRAEICSRQCPRCRYASLGPLAGTELYGVDVAWAIKYIGMPAYAPGLLFLYKYMLSQRSKVLAKAPKQKTL